MKNLFGKKPIFRRKAPSFLPSTAVLEMTYCCSHECLFCSCPWFAEKSGFTVEKELAPAEWKNIIRKLCDMGVSNIAFTGGEPLLKNGIEDIISFAASCRTEHIETKKGRLVSVIAQPRLYLLSNGHAMTRDVLKLCRKFHINLSMSLPGLSSFREHTQAGSAQKILDCFTQAKNMGVRTTAGITVTRKNIAELYETISAALIAGADTILLNRFLPGGRGLAHANELSLSTEEVRRMLDIAEDVLESANRYGSVGTELPLCIIPQRPFTHLKVGTRCSAAIDFFVIGPSGYVRVCNHSPVRLEHCSDIEKLTGNPYWKTFVFKKYLPGQCSSCGLLLNCDGGCREAAHISGGSVSSPDPLIAACGEY